MHTYVRGEELTTLARACQGVRPTQDTCTVKGYGHGFRIGQSEHVCVCVCVCVFVCKYVTHEH
jgi:hypothetical protein